MVNFNNETTVTQSSNELVKITRLEKRYNLFEAMEFYFKAKFLQHDTGDEIQVVRARALNLYWEMEGELTRYNKQKKKTDLDPTIDFQKIKDALSNKDGNETDLFNAISTINVFLDDIGLTRIDTRHRYDTTRVELENKEMNL